MGIRLKTDIDALMREKQKKLLEAVENAFISAGEEAVKEIRATKTYKDKTGRLTASIGYGVARDGTLIASGGFGNGEGGQTGQDALMGLVSQRKGLVLIIVAGMDYAIYVERKGYVVLDGGTLRVERYITEKLRNLDI